MSEGRRDGFSIHSSGRGFQASFEVRIASGDRSGGQIHMSCHCTLPNALTMDRVHEVITALENRLKLGCSEAHTVLIHPRPETDKHR
jgi:divalent metal cation (Fe/Co/Zn/Cd) transporter